MHKIRKDVLTRYEVYKQNAKERGYAFNLSLEQFTDITNQSCHYCGGFNAYNGVDRKDNGIGYELNNCLPCCGTCNRMKSTINYDKFISQCKLIASKQTH